MSKPDNFLLCEKASRTEKLFFSEPSGNSFPASAPFLNRFCSKYYSQYLPLSLSLSLALSFSLSLLPALSHLIQLLKALKNFLTCFFSFSSFFFLSLVTVVYTDTDTLRKAQS